MARSISTWPQQALMMLVKGYRLMASPWLGSACRFTPTCSAYALQALGRHGAAAGAYMTLRRIARCHPFCEGGHDPLPDRLPAVFRLFANDTPPTAVGTPLTPIDETAP